MAVIRGARVGPLTWRWVDTDPRHPSIAVLFVTFRG